MLWFVWVHNWLANAIFVRMLQQQFHKKITSQVSSRVMSWYRIQLPVDGFLYCTPRTLPRLLPRKTWAGSSAAFARMATIQNAELTVRGTWAIQHAGALFGNHCIFHPLQLGPLVQLQFNHDGEERVDSTTSYQTIHFFRYYNSGTYESWCLRAEAVIQRCRKRSHWRTRRLRTSVRKKLECPLLSWFLLTAMA